MFPVHELVTVSRSAGSPHLGPLLIQQDAVSRLPRPASIPLSVGGDNGASGANVKVVQQMLGHKSATMTLDLYGHLFPNQLDEVADRLDAAARAVVYPLCTRADIIPMSVG